MRELVGIVTVTRALDLEVQVVHEYNLTQTHTVHIQRSISASALWFYDFASARKVCRSTNAIQGYQLQRSPGSCGSEK